jgi:hypothetical protein
MLDWGPDLVVAFAGGTGTAGMVALAALPACVSSSHEALRSDVGC